MSLFQNSVLRNYLKNIDTTPALQAYERYRSDFLPKIANIRTSKEEQYQYGFLDDLFVKILGYTLNPSPEYNLIAEQKNLSDAKKADGAVLRDGNVIAVIELKSTKTKSMEKIVNQAFGYKHNHPTCKYVITSNFEKLRLYVEYSDKYEEFDLFELDESRFVLLYSLLCKENLWNNTPLTLKQQSKLQEEGISNELYKKYAKLRIELFENIIQNNPEIDKNILLEKTQTILDRMVFIFFAEDRGILKPNTIQAIITHYRNDIENRDLWHFYKIYFNAINSGNTKLGIPEYNGGLFAEDEVLDAIIIDDGVIEMLPLALSAYDFNTDIDVNILGHIFENSLNDIEELKARINDENFNASKSKRKKDGVFYTPEYITKYIVDNTLGSLCQAKKEELGLDDVEIDVPKNPKKLNKTQTKQKEALEAYREYLLGLKILDPACGSGAFLNQALNYLLEEHAFIDEGIRTLMGGSVLGLYDVKKGILENNLYGVDINAEAVEIAKLSLWLRTVESGRKLNKLADKIKVGNSLIDDKGVVENAFVWEEEFAEVFEQGGFDVLMGNPPYIMEDDNKSAFNGLHNKECYQGKTDIWHLFTCQAIDLTKQNRYISFIAKNQWLTSASASKMRKKIYIKTEIKEIIDFGVNLIFENVGQQTMIFVLQKRDDNKKHLIDYIKFTKKTETSKIIETMLNPKKSDYTLVTKKELPKEFDEKENLTFSSLKIENILAKIDSKRNFSLNSKKEIIQGIIGAPDKAFIVTKNELNNFLSNEKEFIKMLHTNTKAYYTPDSDKYIFYISKQNFEGKKLDSYPNIKNHFESFKDELKQKKINYKTPTKPYFYLHRERDETFFKKGVKLIFTSRTKGKDFTYTEKAFYGTRNLFFIKSDRIDLKYLTALLNSKLFYFYMTYRLKHTGDLLQIDKNQFLKIPIYTPNDTKDFDILVDNIIQAKKIVQKYQKHIDSLSAIEKIEIKEEIEKLEDSINEWIYEIDAMVYELYGLTDEEIAVVEGRA